MKTADFLELESLTDELFELRKRFDRLFRSSNYELNTPMYIALSATGLAALTTSECFLQESKKRREEAELDRITEQELNRVPLSAMSEGTPG